MTVFKRLWQMRKEAEYRGGSPNRAARVQNRVWGWLFGIGVAGSRAGLLEVKARNTGRRVTLPVAVVHHEGQRYLVAMLGPRTQWVLNVHADAGRAVLRHGRRERITLVDDFSDDRAAILRRYVSIAPGARPHVRADRRDSLEAFERIVDDYPIFRITPRNRI